jgi:hypothetical protein
MSWPKNVSFEIEYEFRPSDPEAPSRGDGLVYLRHSVYDCIEICDDDHLAGLLLFKMIFYCRRATLTLDGYRWYVRSRASLCSETRLSRHQYDRALRRLKFEFGYVETRRLPLSKVGIFGNYTAFRVAGVITVFLKGVRDYGWPPWTSDAVTSSSSSDASTE